MWLLDAWENAEKITYPVVWEETKDASNVIDYDIREEQTKDISAQINANNQTTTGMATVIPWINAPKLLEWTSIIETKKVWYIHAKVAFYWDAMSDWDVQTLPIYYITDKIWEPNFYVINVNRLKFPADWVYKLHIIFPYWMSPFYWKTNVWTNKQWFIATDTSTTTWINHELDLTLSFVKWETLTVDCTLIASWWSWTTRPFVTIEFTRLW